MDEPPDSLRFDTGVATILIADAAASDRFVGAIDALRGRVVARIGWDVPLPLTAAPQVVAVDAAGLAPDRLAERLPSVVAWAAEMAASLVVALTLDQIDVVAAAVLDGRTALLVDPTVADCAAALAIAGERARVPAGVFDVGRESDTARLERLNGEVARIAEALARLTRAESERDLPVPPIVGDRTSGYGPPPAIAGPNAAQIRRTIRARRMRDQFFGDTLFEDPGWDMLLDLYAAELERVRVSVSSLCIAAAVAPTTALRWIARMTEAGLFERRPDPHDRRRAFMALTVGASKAMEGYMIAITRGDLNIA